MMGTRRVKYVLSVMIWFWGMVACTPQAATPALTTLPASIPTLTPAPPPPRWQPLPRTTWQIQLNGALSTAYPAAVYDVDLFDTPAEVIADLHRMGRKVICYFSAGSWEDWRPDAARFPPEVIGKPLPNWPGERYLDIRQQDALRPLMAARLDLAMQKGCDAVDPDNVQNYLEDSGFPLTFGDQLRYNRWLASAAHARGMAIGLKNNLPQVTDLVGVFDFAVNESCFTYQECDQLRPFIAAEKAVFAIEYEAEAADVCPQANAWGFSLLLKHWELDAWRYSCLQDYPKE